LTGVCRVVPDVTAVEREFDYIVPDRFAPLVRVGTIVRVPLHGRRVRGWVVADDVEPAAAADRLLELLAVSSAGPPPEVVDLAGWVAWRWAGPRVAVLRSASPPNRVAPSPPASPPGSSALSVTPERTKVRSEVRPEVRPEVRIVRRAPLLDRRTTVEELLSPEGSTIVLVADFARAVALARHLGGRGQAVALLHSGASDAARTDAWRRAAQGRVVVVGGRVAVFAPVPDLRAAIVVDDADEALQEERSPTWHARDVLLERAARAGIPFAVVSAVPTVEVLGLAEPTVETDPPDVERAGWPRTLVVDRRDEPPGAGLLSDTLATSLRTAGGLAVCVLNRRGRFRVLVCDQCRAVLRWDRTDDRPAVCPECGATRLRVVRAGVTRIREELAALVAGARVVDVDTTTAEVPDANIVVGTEAVLHRAEIRRRRPTLVAFLDLDQELLAPRYRAGAQAHWLVTRGAQLLAGRPRAETMLLLQTRLPDHVVVEAVTSGRPDLVATAELDDRRMLGYPPFGALAELSGDDDALAAVADALRVLDVPAAAVTVFGPSDGRVLVHAPEWGQLADALELSLPAGRSLGRVRAAVDPPRV
jgi:primosomal protein N' (replication factor Y)